MPRPKIPAQDRKKNVSIRFLDEVYQELKKQAYREGFSVGQLIEKISRIYLKTVEPAAKIYDESPDLSSFPDPDITIKELVNSTDSNTNQEQQSPSVSQPMNPCPNDSKVETPFAKTSQETPSTTLKTKLSDVKIETPFD